MLKKFNCDEEIFEIKENHHAPVAILTEELKLSISGKDETDYSQFDPKELAMGIEDEKEHTDDENIAKKLVSDHLKKDPKYYSKIRTLEKV